MDKILDEGLIPERKNESKINRITVIIRLAVCVCFIGIQLFKIIEIMSSNLHPSTGEKLAFLSGYLVSSIILALFVYYNWRHAKLEQTMDYVLPYFRKPFILMFLFYILFQFVNITSNLSGSAYVEVNYDFLYFVDLVLLGLLLFLSKREFIYYRRAV